MRITILAFLYSSYMTRLDTVESFVGMLPSDDIIFLNTVVNRIDDLPVGKYPVGKMENYYTDMSNIKRIVNFECGYRNIGKDVEVKNLANKIMEMEV